jgi:branched-chain amino acid transport system substrate-binding protein
VKRIGLILLLLALCGCGSDGERVQVVISAPVSTEPWIAGSIERGARLAADEINDNGGVLIGDGSKELELVVLDNASSPATAQANAREAVSRGAAVLLTDGTGATSVAAVTDPAKLPCSSSSRAAPT